MSDLNENPLLKGQPAEPLISSATLEETTDADAVFIFEAIQGYLAKGLKQAEAEMMARKDLEEINAHKNQKGEEMWNRLNKEFRSWQLYHDQMLRALAFYSGEWEEKNKPHTLKFEFRLASDGVTRDKKGAIKTIASASIICNYAMDGVWKKWFHKKIGFRHLREMREGDQWKLELYEAAFREFILYACTFKMIIHDHESGKYPQPAPGTEPAGAERNIVSTDASTPEGTPTEGGEEIRSGL